MAYTPTNWVDGTTPVNEANLDKMEGGIQAAHVTADAAVPKTIVDVKGDLIAATAADAVARVPLGTNGQVLTVDTSLATGLKYAVPAAGGSDLSYEGSHVPASAHQDGDIVVKDGIAYIAVRDTNQNPDPSLWGAVGIPTPPTFTTIAGELAYAEFSTAVTITGTTDATGTNVVTLPSLSCDGATPILLDFFAPYANPGAAAGSFFYVGIWDGATQVGRLTIQTAETAIAAYAPVRATLRLTPSAGAHVYSAKAWHTGPGAGSIGGAVGGPGSYVPGFLRASLAQPTIVPSPGQAVAVAYGTSLPPNPVDGQEAILVDSATAPTYQWRFRFNANSTQEKWEFVGGPPLRKGGGTASVSGMTPVEITGFPTISLPRAGRYRFIFGASVTNQGTFAVGPYGSAVSLRDRGTLFGNEMLKQYHSASFDGAAMSTDAEATLPAGAIVSMWVVLDRAANLTSVLNPWVQVTPVRVS